MTLTTQVTIESLTVAKYFVSALGGCIEMQSLGVDSLVDLRGQTVAITGVGSEDVGIATLNVSQTETGGVIGLSVQGKGLPSIFRQCLWREMFFPSSISVLKVSA